jgi:hypothetical protein
MNIENALKQLEAPATWAQKILAIRKAAEKTGRHDLHLVKRNLAVGEEHMTYKDYTEFGCSCEQEYIFGEASHLIEERELPFDEALTEIKADQCLASLRWAGNGGTMFCNADPQLGGIIDMNRQLNTWFVVFNDPHLDCKEDFKTREEALRELLKAVDEKYQTAKTSPGSPGRSTLGGW